MRTLALLPLFALCAAPLAAGTSTQQNPKVVFGSVGSKQVTLKVCNARGCTTTTKTVIVLDPRPAISGLGVSPSNAQAGDLVVLSARATGKPPLSYTWRIKSSAATLVTLAGNPVAWPTLSTPAPLALTAELTVTNASGSVTSSMPFSLSKNAPRLYFTINPCRLYDSRSGSSRLTSADSIRKPSVTSCGIPAGATAVAGNLTAVAPTGSGDLVAYPSDYPSPPSTTSLSFNAGKTRTNFAILPLGRDGAGTFAISANLPREGAVDVVADAFGYWIEEAALVPVPLTFHAPLCSAGFCLFPTNTPIFFEQTLTGLPTSYGYDWDGNGSFEQTSATPVLTHVYTASNLIVAPKWRALRGTSASAALTHDPFVATLTQNLALRPSPPTTPVVAFTGYTTRPTDPRWGSTLLASYSVRTSPGTSLLGFHAYLTIGLSRTITAAISPSGLGSVYLPASDASAGTARLDLTALSTSAESLPSASVLLPRP